MESTHKTVSPDWFWAQYHRRIHAIRREVAKASGRYSDIAITPLRENEMQALDLFHATRGGEDAQARKRRDDAIRMHTDRKAPGTAPT